MKSSILTMALLAMCALAACGSKPKTDASLKNADTAQAAAQKAPGAEWKGSFAMCNCEGTKFIIISSEADTAIENAAKQYAFAIIEGKTYPVKYVGRQTVKKPESRETCDNFDGLSGYVFENTGKPVPPDQESDDPDYVMIEESAFLVKKDFLTVYKPIPYNVVGMKADKKLIDEMEKKYGRKVVSSLTIATFGDEKKATEDNSLSCFQFANKGNKALAIYLMKAKDGKNYIKEFPAEWNDVSVWRVDDCGNFAMGAANINTIFNTPEGYVFMINDWGSESLGTYFLRQSGNQLIEIDGLSNSRYTMVL